MSRLIEFLQETGGKLSHKRLWTSVFALMLCIEWGAHIFTGFCVGATVTNSFQPSWETVGLVSAALGITMAGKKAENAHSGKEGKNV